MPLYLGNDIFSHKISSITESSSGDSNYNIKSIKCANYTGKTIQKGERVIITPNINKSLLVKQLSFGSNAVTISRDGSYIAAGTTVYDKEFNEISSTKQPSGRPQIYLSDDIISDYNYSMIKQRGTSYGETYYLTDNAEITIYDSYPAKQTLKIKKDGSFVSYPTLSFSQAYSSSAQNNMLMINEKYRLLFTDDLRYDACVYKYYEDNSKELTYLTSHPDRGQCLGCTPDNEYALTKSHIYKCSENGITEIDVSELSVDLKLLLNTSNRIIYNQIDGILWIMKTENNNISTTTPSEFYTFKYNMETQKFDLIDSFTAQNADNMYGAFIGASDCSVYFGYHIGIIPERNENTYTISNKTNYISTGSLQGLAKENIEDKSTGIVDVIMTK